MTLPFFRDIQRALACTTIGEPGLSQTFRTETLGVYMAGKVSGCIVEFALTAEMVINAFSMAREEFFEIVGKASNKSSPFMKVIYGGQAAATANDQQPELPAHQPLCS